MFFEKGETFRGNPLPPAYFISFFVIPRVYGHDFAVVGSRGVDPDMSHGERPHHLAWCAVPSVTSKSFKQMSRHLKASSKCRGI
jgi:hypothetical protein